MPTLLARKKTISPEDQPRPPAPVPGAPPAAKAVPVSRTPSVFNERCPSQIILERIADKWTVLIIYKLDKKTMRFGELKREVGGVSQKMLTQTLRNLEADGLVKREVYAVVPPKVEYSLTPLGKTLLSPLGALCRWSQEHMEEVMKMHARRRKQS